MLPAWKSILKRLKSVSAPTRPVTRANRATLRAEALEDRTVPSLMLRLEQEGYDPVTITDNGPGDDNSAVGFISFFGSYGTFALNSTIGFSNLGTSPNNDAVLDLQSVNATSTTGGVLKITAVQTDYNLPSFPSNPITLQSLVSGAVSGSGSQLTVQGWANANNASPLTSVPTVIPAGSVSPGVQGPFTSSNFSSDLSTTFTRNAGSYSLIAQGILTLAPNSDGRFDLFVQTTGPQSPPPQPQAWVTLTPDATNEVGHPHTFTATVYQDDGLPIGAPGGDNYNGPGVAVGANVNVALTNMNGASAPTTLFSGTTNASGQFQVTFASDTAGQVIGNATASLVVGGQTLVRDTDPNTAIISGPGGSGPATKTYVDAKIVIAPDATNEVGKPHTFTVTVYEDAGDGLGFVPAANEDVVITLTNKNGATASVDPSLLTGKTDANGQFKITFASDTAGLVIGNASASIVVGGLTLIRDTDPATSDVGAGPVALGESGPATKRFVDAKIVLTPATATNPVSGQHVITATVYQDDGLNADQGGDGVTGWALAPNGTVVNFGLTNSNGSTATFVGGSSAVVTGGTASVTINSPTAGLVTINGTTTFLVGGQTLTRDTDPSTTPTAGPGGSGAVTKRYVDAKIVLTPSEAVNPIGEKHVITATVYQDDGLTAAQGGDGVTGWALAPNGTVVNFGLTNSSGATATFVGSSSGTVSGGTTSVTINSSTAGLVTINGTTTFLVGGQTLTRDTDPATTPTSGPGGSGPAKKTYVKPGIDIEKTTNGPSNTNTTKPDYDNEDAVNGPGVPILIPGTPVTWTYKVTNTGGLPYAVNEVVVTDDNGTPSDTSDDLSTTKTGSKNISMILGNGTTTANSTHNIGDLNNNNFLDPNEVWYYKATGVVQAVGSVSTGTAATFDFSGNSSTTGSSGNVRTYTSGTLSVHASAFSRTSGGTWNSAYLGSYSGGLGVTDGSESGSAPNHATDNSGRVNYIMLEFSENVIIDSAYLGYVYGDSDLTYWIGTISGAFNTHQTLSDSLLASLGFTEVNNGGSSARTANLNSGSIVGNVIIIAAKTTDCDDFFKLEKVVVGKTKGGIYENKATVTVPGGSDCDLSHYKNPDKQPPTGNISGYKFNDKDADGKWDTANNCWYGSSGAEGGLSGWKIFVDYDRDGQWDTNEPYAVTDANGYYKITGVKEGTWEVVEVSQNGWVQTTRDQYVTVVGGETETDVNFGNHYVGKSSCDYDYRDCDYRDCDDRDRDDKDCGYDWYSKGWDCNNWDSNDWDWYWKNYC